MTSNYSLDVLLKSFESAASSSLFNIESPKCCSHSPRTDSLLSKNKEKNF
ncbi:Uncharacterized protein BM_BM13226 [Brugia malayi]|uniref:Bm13226 n=1 Tax=Brugia malayi TaxID=6279 RepID=A0A0J9Y5A8_BRUMA|nr:Uncharacterized protein BM_BM13226 [Brugia malayi]CDQ02689.1 Bm13226 [Brugia malayi]VIO96686.1 Uncharacterized protein BM_BM13226 [Brugia malayi]